MGSGSVILITENPKAGLSPPLDQPGHSADWTLRPVAGLAHFFGGEIHAGIWLDARAVHWMHRHFYYSRMAGFVKFRQFAGLAVFWL
jgi:hypothetical protein